MLLRGRSPRRVWVIADFGAFAALVFFVLYYLTSFRFDDLLTGDPRRVDFNYRQVDFRQWYKFPPLIARHLEYPSVVWNDWTVPFPYLPSAVAMFLPVSKLPEAAAFAGWMVLQAASFAIVIWTALRLTGAEQFRARLLIALGAALLTDNPLGWDFRAHNTNTIYLALIMSGLAIRSSWLSGLKIYSGSLFFVFVWRREYRLAAGMLIATALIAIALPIAVFGLPGYTQLLRGWLGQALFDPPAGRPAVLPADLLRQSGALLLGNAPSSVEVSIFVRMSQAIWTMLVICYFVRATKWSGSVAGIQARLCDVCVALLAPLPFSIWFMPYHAIVLLPANMLLLTVALDKTWETRARQAAVAALLGSQSLQYSLAHWELRGATSLVSFALIVLALGVVRSAA